MSEKNSPRKADKIVAVKGMNDIMPPESAVWEALESRVRDLMRRFAFENVRTPIVEPTALFVRGLGEVTDIVEKEMYSFEDRLNGEALTLRPENTAGVVRAAVEHSMLYTALSASITWGRCSVMSALNAAGIGSFIRLVLRHWVSGGQR